MLVSVFFFGPLGVEDAMNRALGVLRVPLDHACFLRACHRSGRYGSLTTTIPSNPQAVSRFLSHILLYNDTSPQPWSLSRLPVGPGSLHPVTEFNMKFRLSGDPSQFEVRGFNHIACIPEARRVKVFPVTFQSPPWRPVPILEQSSKSMLTPSTRMTCITWDPPRV
ncbi:hypothetical protein BGZ61DRAFT_161226 [Ilyonectria robusta]|uniref:uncharacterized protein n=1 Tax=Ilyonectria robusta TaxID=1079257 RepID=UPI001E8CAD11|nr:uncharacterized protein BGZ61DRAFT_161226 [Ilyonectria robusta]KAH8733506.1 hypothetical protein BGZ61DRAFT_161226 [Ilyonectria robusta]